MRSLAAPWRNPRPQCRAGRGRADDLARAWRLLTITQASPIPSNPQRAPPPDFYLFSPGCRTREATTRLVKGGRERGRKLLLLGRAEKSGDWKTPAVRDQKQAVNAEFGVRLTV